MNLKAKILILKAESLLQERAMNNACAVRDNNRDGWTWDYAERDKELGAEIDGLIKQLESTKQGRK